MQLQRLKSELTTPAKVTKSKIHDHTVETCTGAYRSIGQDIYKLNSSVTCINAYSSIGQKYIYKLLVPVSEAGIKQIKISLWHTLICAH